MSDHDDRNAHDVQEAREQAAEEHVDLLPDDEQDRQLGRGVWAR